MCIRDRQGTLHDDIVRLERDKDIVHRGNGMNHPLAAERSGKVEEHDIESFPPIKADNIVMQSSLQFTKALEEELVSRKNCNLKGTWLFWNRCV